MKMTREKKQEIVAGLRTRLVESPNVYVTDFTGIAVKPMTELRRKLRAAGGEYIVVKNTLALQALEAAKVEGLREVLDGPTAFVFAGDGPLGTAKVLAEFQKEHESLTIKAGLVDGRYVSAEEVKRLASLPPRDVLLGQLAATLQAPLAGFVGALSGLMNQFVGALEALRAQRT